MKTSLAVMSALNINSPSVLQDFENTNKSISLEVPVSLHVFEKYYFQHYFYRYIDEYFFQDKVLVFDAKNSHSPQQINNYLFEEIVRGSEGNFSVDYSQTHMFKDFVDWSHNPKTESLKDILRVDISGSDKLFSPLDKKIYLDYSHPHKSKIPIYAFYFLEDTSVNHYSDISFGKLKDIPQSLDEIYARGDVKKSCEEARSNYHQHYYSSFSSPKEGYEGICDYIQIITDATKSWSENAKNQTFWSTPYVAYRQGIKEGWDEQYYFYNLGNLFGRRGKSANLVKNSSKIWFIDYDKVFSLIPESNKLKVSLNFDSEKLKFLSSPYGTKDDAMLNFFKISSSFKFDISWSNLEKDFHHSFTIKDILEDRVTIDVDPSENIFNVSLSVSSLNADLLNIFGQRKYELDIDKLIQGNRIFENIEFSLPNPEEIIPSELLDINKLSGHFYFSSLGKKKKIPLNALQIKYLNVQGEVDDLEGTANFSYTWNGKSHQVNLYGLQTIPDLSGVNINANSVDDALTRLKELFPNTSNYFWDNLIFRESSSRNSLSSQTLLDIVAKQKKSGDPIKMKNKWIFSDYEIKIHNSRDIFLIPKTQIPEKYENISDLFELNDYAFSLNLSKDDYQYKVVEKTNNRLEVLVSFSPRVGINEGIFRGPRRFEPEHKLYSFDISGINKVNDEVELKSLDSGWFLSPENILIIGAGSIFSGATLVSFLKKFGFLKSKII